MMSKSTIVGIFLILFSVFGIVTVAALGSKLGKYEDTVAEYVMCIKYNTDGDCSDIILSEYGEEVE